MDSVSEVEDSLIQLMPARPTEPLSSDCCGSGCVPCVYDIYQQDLQRWRQQCENITVSTQPENVSCQESRMCKQEYREFELISVRQQCEACFVFRFSLPDEKTLQFYPAQHLYLGWQRESGTVTRAYTILTDGKRQNYFEVLIKIYPEGKMSEYIGSWKPGNKVLWRGPFGEFRYTPNEHRRLLMLAAGTGMLPMLQIIRTILQNEADDTRLQLVCATAYYRAILFKNELDAWQDYWNFSLVYFLSQVDHIHHLLS